MILPLPIPALLLPGVIRFGPLRLSVYSLFAATGVIAATSLSQRTARLVGLKAEKLWDADVFAIVAAFVISRVLLVLVDIHSFLQYPLLVLSLPSLTYGGMVLTGLFVWAYLRVKKMPILDVVDAWAPCAALLAAVLQLGHFVEGTDAGMPTSLPWGVPTPGDNILGKVHPVQLYGVAIGAALCIVLMRLLSKPHRSGLPTALALMAGGASAFLLDMLRQPMESQGDALLDPGQWVALVGVLAGVLLWAGSPETSPQPMTLITAQLHEESL